MLKHGDVLPGDLVAYDGMRGGKMTRRYGVVTVQERRPGQTDSFWAVWDNTISGARALAMGSGRQASMCYNEESLRLVARADDNWDELDDLPDREPTAWDTMC